MNALSGKIAIAGASGFVGKSLLNALGELPEKPKLVGFSRKTPEPGKTDVEWRKVDLLDLASTLEALKDCDLAYYLVHAMLPQARLSQGDFADFDLLQADNFARACAARGVKEIVYLGGILPEGIAYEDLSPHLRSRLEVEKVLGSYGARVTTLRAALIIGPGGSSSEMLLRLVRRLPVMLGPKWTQTPAEPVDISDVIYSLTQVFVREDLRGKSWDLGGGERVSYQDLLQKAAAALGVHRRVIPVPFISPRISRLWVSTITGAPKALVAPLIESLKHPMLPREDSRLLAVLGRSPVPLEESLRRAIEEPLSPHAYKKPKEKKTKRVRSLQRLLPKDPRWFSSDAESVAENYFLWMPKALFGIIRVEKTNGELGSEIRFRILGMNRALLILRAVPQLAQLSVPKIEVYWIAGGLLHTDKTQGILEFRVLDSVRCVLASVQDFYPRLPWFIYRWTQAVVHLWVMRRFARSLEG